MLLTRRLLLGSALLALAACASSDPADQAANRTQIDAGADAALSELYAEDAAARTLAGQPRMGGAPSHPERRSTWARCEAAAGQGPCNQRACRGAMPDPRRRAWTPPRRFHLAGPCLVVAPRVVPSGAAGHGLRRLDDPGPQGLEVLVQMIRLVSPSMANQFR